ncbi:hypothetical protein HANVADRAFT_53407 [Hanseniaspora valbyensis NRRL Y-1626]|uniref:Extracellular membrane protein CFEM domain-containing protein n=1 Tax=Hanseniaspora valbyensis NRRL Y-1626 TaxID=766949 RepID=A0A1B7TBI5_9ASCO|nr:hypothetical protein HANVADRAFT_53407 [Hanseniaspora valbyensis NRRL Y-1626]
MKLHSSFIISTVLISLPDLLSGLKLPTHCLMECTSNNLGKYSNFHYTLDDIKDLCSNNDLHRLVLSCLEENCETPSFKKLNVKEFTKLCSATDLLEASPLINNKKVSYKEDQNRDEKNNGNSNLEKRLSYVGDRNNAKIKKPNLLKDQNLNINGHYIVKSRNEKRNYDRNNSLSDVIFLNSPSIQENLSPGNKKEFNNLNLKKNNKSIESFSNNDDEDKNEDFKDFDAVKSEKKLLISKKINIEKVRNNQYSFKKNRDRLGKSKTIFLINRD